MVHYISCWGGWVFEKWVKQCQCFYLLGPTPPFPLNWKLLGKTDSDFVSCMQILMCVLRGTLSARQVGSASLKNGSVIWTMTAVITVTNLIGNVVSCSLQLWMDCVKPGSYFPRMQMRSGCWCHTFATNNSRQFNSAQVVTPNLPRIRMKCELG